MDFEASRASGCKGAACPCLDAPDAPPGSRRCVRLGDRLVDVPQGWSDFERRSFVIYAKASAQGRTQPDYAAGIKLGRAYASRPWLRRIATALGIKPYTLGLWAANRVLVAPPAAPAAAAAHSAHDAINLDATPSAGACASAAAPAST